MKIKDQSDWRQWVTNNQDPYGRAIINYAQRWAELMEEKMKEGAKLEDIAKQTSREADGEGITGYMYGAAVSVLSTSWEYGEQLRLWHNIDTQIGTEGDEANKTGGVLNPALLNVGEK